MTDYWFIIHSPCDSLWTGPDLDKVAAPLEKACRVKLTGTLINQACGISPSFVPLAHSWVQFRFSSSLNYHYNTTLIY